MATTTINSEAVATNIHKAVIDNIFTEILHVPGFGCTEGFTDETNAAYVRILQQIPGGARARTLGATVNGLAKNNSAALQPTSQEFELPLTQKFDRMYDILDSSQDMIKVVNLMESTGKIIAGELAREINCATLACQLVAACNAIANTAVTGQVASTVNTAVNGAYLAATLSAGGYLDDGDSANYIDSFPSDAREILGRSSYVVGLLKSQNVIAGGSNYAQEMLARGVVSPYSAHTGKQYKGEVNGTPVFLVPSIIWTKALDWCSINTNGVVTDALDQSTYTFAGVDALYVAAMGTARGICISNYTKTIDCPDGAGYRVQPEYRFGVVQQFAKAAQVIADANWTNPASYTNANSYRWLVFGTAPSSRTNG